MMSDAFLLFAGVCQAREGTPACAYIRSIRDILGWYDYTVGIRGLKTTGTVTFYVFCYVF
jgi:hypothetical protein